MDLVIEHHHVLAVVKTDKGSEAVIKLRWDLCRSNDFLIDMPFNHLTLHVDHCNEVEGSFLCKFDATLSPVGLTAEVVMLGVFDLASTAVETQQGIWFMWLICARIVSKRSDAELNLIFFGGLDDDVEVVLAGEWQWIFAEDRTPHTVITSFGYFVPLKFIMRKVTV